MSLDAYRDDLPGIEARAAVLRRSRAAEHAALSTLLRLEVRHTARTYLGFAALLTSVASGLSGAAVRVVFWGVVLVGVLVVALTRLGEGWAGRFQGAKTSDPRRELHELQWPLPVRRGLSSRCSPAGRAPASCFRSSA